MSAHRHVTIDLEFEETTVHGTLDAGAGARQFLGWLELLARLQELGDQPNPEEPKPTPHAN